MSWHLLHKYNLEQWVHISIKGVKVHFALPNTCTKTCRRLCLMPSNDILYTSTQYQQEELSDINVKSDPVYYGCVKAQGLWHKLIMRTSQHVVFYLSLAPEASTLWCWCVCCLRWLILFLKILLDDTDNSRHLCHGPFTCNKAKYSKVTKIIY